jgi:uncharacterized membrane protein YphA (DoxX/SURF4 family)
MSDKTRTETTPKITTAAATNTTDIATTAATRGRTIAYWAVTVVVALAFLAGGLTDLSRGPAVAAIMAHLGYPVYFAALLGFWKIAGAVAVLAPGFPRLKEWAYAGMFFDLSGAAVSHAARGDGAARIMTPLALLVLVIASWALRPPGRRLAAPGAGALRRAPSVQHGAPASATA